MKAHNEDALDTIIWFDGHACLTGDCPHKANDECLEALIAHTKKECPAAREQLAALRQRAILERDQARGFGEDCAKKYNDLIARGPVLTCAFCGWEYPAGTPATGHQALTAHVHECEKHPLRARIVELETALRAVVDELECQAKIYFEDGSLDTCTDRTVPPKDGWCAVCVAKATFIAPHS